MMRCSAKIQCMCSKLSKGQRHGGSVKVRYFIVPYIFAMYRSVFVSKCHISYFRLLISDIGLKQSVSNFKKQIQLCGDVFWLKDVSQGHQQPNSSIYILFQNYE